MGLIKKIFKWLLISFGAMIALLVVCGIIVGQMETAKEKKERETKLIRSDSISTVAEEFISEGELDTAEALLAKARALAPKADSKAKALRIQIQKLKKEKTNHAILLSLSDDEYALLKKGELQKTILENKHLNRMLIDDMYSQRNKRAYLLRKREQERKEKQRQAKLAEAKRKADVAKAEAIIRKEYAKTLRTQFLDMGLDIKVRVTGTGNKRLILTYALFNDVWMRKFETSGNYDAWHKLGFDRVDLKDGYDYHRYYYWKK